MSSRTSAARTRPCCLRAAPSPALADKPLTGYAISKEKKKQVWERDSILSVYVQGGGSL